MNYLSSFESTPQSFLSFGYMDASSFFAVVVPILNIPERSNCVREFPSVPGNAFLTTGNRAVFTSGGFLNYKFNATHLTSRYSYFASKFICTRNTSSSLIVNLFSAIKTSLSFSVLIFLRSAIRAKSIVVRFRRGIDATYFAKVHISPNQNALRVAG